MGKIIDLKGKLKEKKAEASETELRVIYYGITIAQKEVIAYMSEDGEMLESVLLLENVAVFDEDGTQNVLITLMPLFTALSSVLVDEDGNQSIQKFQIPVKELVFIAPLAGVKTIKGVVDSLERDYRIIMTP